MRNFKKFLVASLMCFVLTGSTVAAAADENNIITSPGEASTVISYSQASTFSVAIAKTITMNSDKTGNYTVTVTGDLASSDTVSVNPIDEKTDVEGINFTFVDQSKGATTKADVVASVTQDKTSWSFSDLSTVGNGTISAPALSAGTWNGVLTFEIGLTTASSN